MPIDATAAMAATWERVRERLGAYDLLLPGSASFVCRAQDCDVHCCRVFSVSLDEREAERMTARHGLQLVEFVECEDGAPIRLPLARPYLLARRDGGCAMLVPGSHFCGTYEGRPDACRQYPHHVLFVDPATARPVHGDLPRMKAALAALPRLPEGGLVPLLLGHRECPGFEGPPLEQGAWLDLLRETAALQYGLIAAVDS